MDDPGSGSDHNLIKRALLQSVTPRVTHALAECVATSDWTNDAVQVESFDGGIEVTTSVRGPYRGKATILDIELAVADLALHSMRGGAFESSYPAEAFSVRTRVVHPRLPEPYGERLASLDLGSSHGCSSDTDAPFFLVTTLEGSHGLWLAVSWTGDWHARLTKVQGRSAHRLVITALGSELAMEAGDRVVLPSVAMGAFDGDGWTAVRTHLGQIRPNPSQPWVVYNSWFNENATVSADTLLANLDVAADLGVEVVTLDGGWYQTNGPGDDGLTSPGFGTWEPDTVRFPDGLERIAEAVNARGIRFGIWCEFERAHPDSDVARSHPEWLRQALDETLSLIDLGLPEARAWALDLLTSRISRWSLGWLKLDMTTHNVAAYWINDARAELEHIRGLYWVLDEVRRRHPDVVIEGCASGGNRVDREMVARCDTFWLSDQTISPDLVRDTVANARRLLPAQYCYLSVAPQLAETADAFPDGWCIGVMPGVFGLMDRLRDWKAPLRHQVSEQIRQYKAFRELLDGTPLRFVGRSPMPFSDWDALEISGPDGGVLFAHRLLSGESRGTFHGEHTWNVTIGDADGALVAIQRPTLSKRSHSEYRSPPPSDGLPE